MSGSNQSLNVIFDSGETLQRSEMKNASILSLPTAGKGCGFFSNPHFAGNATTASFVQFGDCLTPRPFICTRKVSTQAISK